MILFPRTWFNMAKDTSFHDSKHYRAAQSWAKCALSTMPTFASAFVAHNYNQKNERTYGEEQTWMNFAIGGIRAPAVPA